MTEEKALAAAKKAARWAKSFRTRYCPMERASIRYAIRGLSGRSKGEAASFTPQVGCIGYGPSWEKALATFKAQSARIKR